MQTPPLPTLSCAFYVYKPEGLTSSDVVVRLKKALTKNEYAQKGFRIGHGGTLDPFATGVLVVLVGEATKLADAYLHSKKAYGGIIKIGERTDCADLTGPVIETKEIPSLTNEQWNQHASSFTPAAGGDLYFQIPPMHSAKKHEGKALYELAREGEVVERKAILKKIDSFRVKLESPSTLSFEVECESGTYVRVLAEDLAAKANTLAHLTKLERTKSSDVTLDRCVTLEALLQQIEERMPLQKISGFCPLPLVATHLAEIQIDSEEAKLVRQGLTRITQKICFDASKKFLNARYLLVKQQDHPVALLEKGTDAPLFRIQRVFN